MSVEDDERIYRLASDPFELALLRAYVAVKAAVTAEAAAPEPLDENGLDEGERRACVVLNCDPKDFLQLKAARR